MTFSIVARGPDGRSYGVAVASRFLAVGNAVPAAEAGVGAVATQSYANLAYRPQGLALLRHGATADGTVAGLTAADPGRDSRQLGVVGREGPGATFTGAGCNPWAGGRVGLAPAGEGYACQGNILTGPEVVAEMEGAFLATAAGEPLARRLLAALAAGDAAGGDRRGRQSAALLVVSPGSGYGGSDVAVDLRVDDHPRPIGELARLLDLAELHFARPDPGSLLELTGAVAAEVQAHLRRLGQPDLATWMGVENYEQRYVADHIDPLVLAKLRQAAAAANAGPVEGAAR